ncbi:MAG: PDZ domain-containing protein [Planctomycetes bacterium]|nr:PDZ domain-containing protein [Planctomycetota bacterium]
MRKTVCLLVLLGILVACPALAAQPEVAAPPDLAAQVARLVELAAGKGPDASWALARSLQELGPKVVEALAPHLEKARPTLKLAAASTLLYHGEKERGARILLELAGDESLDSEARRTAVRVLGRQGDRAAARPLKDVMNETLDPLLKLEAARALWDLSFSDRPEAKRVLRGFLQSEDPELEAAGALALAGIDDFEVAKPVLERLQNEPTLRGRLARSYLRTMDSVRQLEDAFYRDPRQAARPNRLDLLEEVLRYIREFHLTGDQRSEEELVETAVRGMLRAIDPHSAYLSAAQRAARARGRYRHQADIGAVVDFDRRGVLSVVRVLPGTPALAAGLRTDDKIIEVDGWSTFDRDLPEVMDRLNGPDGTAVKIKAVRRGWQEPREIAVRRARPVPGSVDGERLPAQIGYVRFPGLTEETSGQLDAVLERLAAQPLRGLVLDLRDNIGEDLTAAVRVVDRFLEAGKLVVYWERHNPLLAPREELRTATAATAPDVPLAVLVNERTASAAEVVAGALGHYQRGVLVGRRTLGRASVQQVLDLTSRPGEPAGTNGRPGAGPGILITIARLFLPDGTAIQRDVDAEGKVLNEGGVAPDVEAEPAEWPGWKEDELSKLLEAGAFGRYLDAHWEKERETLVELAAFDGGDAERYPGFAAFFAGLGTHLEPRDVHRWLRVFVRRKVSESGARPMTGVDATGDYVLDLQLQAALLEVLKRLDPPVDPKSIPEYAGLEAPKKKPASKKPAASTEPDEDE